MRLLGQYITMHFKAQLQYRASFILMTFGQFLVPFTVFYGFFLMFERFGGIPGWTFYEVAMCFAVAHFSFSLAECFVRGFDSFSQLIVSGDFDRLMLRPRNLAFQVVGSKFDFTRIGRLVQAFIILFVALQGLELQWTIGKGLLLLGMIIGGLVTFSGVFILTATLCFWTVTGLEIANLITDGGRELNQFPLSIYEKKFRQFFTIIIPFGMTNYYPMLYLLNKGGTPWYGAAPLCGVAFFIVCVSIWYKGVKKYQSTGS